MQNPLRRAPEREAYFPHIQLKNEEGYWMRRKWNRFVAGLLSIVLRQRQMCIRDRCKSR